MSSKEQAEAERRVRQRLVEPLQRLGLARPTGVTAAQFEAMIDDLCGRLSYMSEMNLDALAEQAAARPGGRDGNRFPIAAKLLTWAAEIQPPADSASPLMRAVFASAIGRAAMAEDWAPELLSFLRKNRCWPKEYDLRGIRERAAEARQRLQKQDEQAARGFFVADTEREFRARRDAALDRCKRIVEAVAAHD